MTTTTVEKPNHRSLPRKKRIPSLRDQAIFLAYRTQGHTQEKLAADNNLSQSRIAQILRRVARWSANLAPSPVSTLDLGPGTLESLSAPELRRLEWLLCRERSQSLYDRSIRAFDHAPASLVTTVEFFSNDAADTPSSSLTPDPCPLTPSSRPPSRLIRTTRQVAPPAQLLRVARQANADLLKLAMSEPPPQPNPEADEALLERLMFERLYQARENSEDEGKVAKSTEGLESFQVVDRWYAALIGDLSYFPIHPADLAPTEPLGQLAQFFHEPSFDTASWGGPPAGPTPTRSVSEGLPTNPSDLEPETCNLEPDSFDLKTENRTLKTSSNTSNPASPKPTLTPSPSTTSSPTFDIRPSTFDSARLSRRLAHERKLEQLKEFRRRGLPCMFEFDPEDGPLPSIHHPGDHCITTPGIFE